MLISGYHPYAGYGYPYYGYAAGYYPAYVTVIIVVTTLIAAGIRSATAGPCSGRDGSTCAG